MARYSLNLSEICEQVTGLNFNTLTEVNPFDRIDTIADAAAPILVSDRYDLLDNDEDKNSFLRMLIEHYWEYEVCALTPSDFILRLNRKLNEIAPLFNQRYESMKMEFPVFQDVNVWTDGQVDRTSETQNHLDTTIKHSDEDTVTDKRKERGSSDTGYGKANIIPKDTKWDYDNDTPQNSISGITDQDYLTNYSKHTDEVDAKTVKLDPWTGEDVTGASYTGNGVNFTAANGNNGGEVGGTETFTGYVTDNELKTKYGHQIKTSGEPNSNTTSQDVSGTHQYGKNNSGKTYAQMMEEYRHAMINVFQEMIDELHELFFIIY